MPRNGSGEYNLPYNWNEDKANGIMVLASRMQGQDQDIADALTNSVATDGQSPLTGDLDFDGNRATDLGDGQNTQDAVVVGQAQTGELQYFGVSSTIPLGTDGRDYEVNANPTLTEYVDGLSFSFVAHFTSIDNPVLRVDTEAELDMIKDDGNGGYTALVAGDIVEDGLYDCSYNEIIGLDKLLIKNPEKPIRDIKTLILQSNPTLTLVSGVIIANGSSLTIDTESSAATDDLDTINGLSDGEIIFIRSANSARNVIVKHNTGNIYNPAGLDIILETTNDLVEGKYDSSLSKLVIISSKSLAPIFNIQDQKASGTSGGTSSSGIQTRTLNTVVTNTINGASLGSNQITLPAGSYKVIATAPGYAAGPHQLFLYNVTDSSYLLRGTSQAMGGGGNANSEHSTVFGIFTLAASKILDLRQYIRDAVADGLGAPVSSGVIEVYSQILIEKIA